MEVILKQDMDNLGYADEIVKVRPGYARNYLIPNGLAAIANEANKKMLAENFQELYLLQEKNNVALLYEGSAGGSIPILRNLEESELTPEGNVRTQSRHRAEREKLKTLPPPPQLDLFIAAGESA